jgi:hypothetical protein
MMACCTEKIDTNLDDIIFILRNLQVYIMHSSYLNLSNLMQYRIERLPHKKKQ